VASGYSTRVAVIPRGSSLPRRPGNVYISLARASITLRWKSPASLEVRHSPGYREVRETEVNGVRISYLPTY
jgi:hypothetical protein